MSKTCHTYSAIEVKVKGKARQGKALREPFIPKFRTFSAGNARLAIVSIMSTISTFNT